MEQPFGDHIAIRALAHIAAMLQDLDHPEQLTGRTAQASDDGTHRQGPFLRGQEF